MRWVFAIVLTVAPSALSGETLGQCQAPDRMITFGSPWDLSDRAVYYPIPQLKTISTAVGLEPAVLMMTVDSHGKVIDISVQRGRSSNELALVAASMRMWIFDPVLLNKEPICMRARIFIYMRTRNDRPEIIISGFSDRDRFRRVQSVGKATK